MSMPSGSALAFFRGKDHIAASFDGERVRLTVFRTAPGMRAVVALKRFDVSGKSNDEIAWAIRSALAEEKIVPEQAITVIPSNLAITKSLEIPSTNPQEIQQIVNLQAGRHTPYAREEIIADYITIGSYRKNYSRVLLVIIAQDVIKRQLDIMNKARLKVDKILFAGEVMAIGCSRVLKLGTGTAVAGVIHIGYSFTDFLAVLKEKLLFVRSIPIGTEHFALEKDRSQIRFIDEIKKTLEVYRSEEIEKFPTELVLTGAVDDRDDIKRMIGESLHIPTRVVPYLTNFQVHRSVAKEAAMLKATSFFDTVAALAVAEQGKVNLIPEEIRLRKAFEQKSREIIKAGIFSLTLISLTCVFLIGKIYFKDAYLKRITAKYQDAVQEAEGLREASAKIDIIKDFMKRRGRPLAVLYELFSLVPADMYLTNIRLDQEGRLVIEGKSRAMAVIFVLAGEIEESKYFRNIELRRTAKREESGEVLVDFEITCMIDEKNI